MSDIVMVGSPELREFFLELLGEASQAKQIDTSDVCQHYLVDVLSEQASLRPSMQQTEQPFVIRLGQALNADSAERFNLLRGLGDEVLFLSGFFAQHLEERGLQESYTCSLGQSAYGGAATTLRRFASGPGVFDELASGFEHMVQLLQYVSDSLCLRAAGDPTAVLELYERWNRSGSSVMSQALAELGVAPMRTDHSIN